MEYNILIGGAAGQGLKSLSQIINKSLKRHGLYVFSHTVYMSRIRGGHNFFQIRFSDKPVYSHSDHLDMILALDQTTIDQHEKRLKDAGIILSDSKLHTLQAKSLTYDLRAYVQSIQHKAGSNMVLLGMLCKVFALDEGIVKKVLMEVFKNKAIEKNILCFDEGYKQDIMMFNIPLKQDNHIMINGNTAIALGAITAGMAFYAAYPMTPATSIMNYLNSKQKATGILVEQAEDEIAAIHMAIGASYTGVRSMTASSGGGLSLMVEALGLTSIAEIPLVVVDVQRPGPATGMATKTSQSDLSFLLTASQDEMPRIILSVTDPEQAFYQTIRAFDLADKYQMLVILLNDQYLADASMTIPRYKLEGIHIDQHLTKDYTDYKRYKITENGVSPRILPGNDQEILVADSHEHNESGQVLEDPDIRTQMHLKRLRKLDAVKSDLIEPTYMGHEDPDLVLLGFGSSYGAIKESVEELSKEEKIGALVFSDLYPLPTQKIKSFENVKFINVEQNATGQLAKLVHSESNITCEHSILKFNGRQLSKEDIIRALKEVN